MTETIGIRELRQNASHYVELAERGEEIVVTRRGEPVARLVALSPLEQRLERLIRVHGVIPPENPHGSIHDIVPLPDDGTDWQATLAQMREERPL